MGQIIGGAAKPKRCNLNKLSQLGTPAAGEYILVSSDNSMNAAGQGDFDAYVVGDGHTAATELPLKKTYANDVDNEPTAGSDNLVKSGGVANAIWYLPLDFANNLEVGSITLRTTGWSYVDNSDRVRTKAGYTIHLPAGCVIEYGGGTSSKINLAYYKNGVYSNESGFVHTYNVTVEADYVFVFSYVNIIDFVLSMLKIYVPNGLSIKFNDIDGQLSEIPFIKSELSDMDSSGNGLYQSLLKENRYIDHNGKLVANNYLDAVYMMPINGHDIIVTNIRSGNASIASYVFYDSTKQMILGSDVSLGANTPNLTINSSDIPEGAKFVSFTLTNKLGSTFDSPTTISELLENLNEKGEEQNIVFNSLYGSGTIEQNNYLLLAQVHIIKNILQSVHFDGNIESISVGCGYLSTTSEAHPTHRGYGAIWANITPTQINIYGHNSKTDVLLYTFNHGLTLGADTTFIATCKYASGSYSTVIELHDGKGNIYETTLDTNWGYGVPFVQNLGSTAVGVETRFMPCDIYKPIWLFGDSYLSLIATARWPYYTAQLGFTHFLLDNRPGENQAEAWADLNTLINLGGRPKTLCWCLGMNGGADTQSGNDYVVNASQKSYIDMVKELCEKLNITPIFATIPTVPTIQHTGLCNYIRSLGCRYIDFAEAVGADAAGNWKAGMLSDDGVHPTQLGAKALAMRAMVDFAEIAEGFEIFGGL